MRGKKGEGGRLAKACEGKARRPGKAWKGKATRQSIQDGVIRLASLAPHGTALPHRIALLHAKRAVLLGAERRTCSCRNGQARRVPTQTASLVEQEPRETSRARLDSRRDVLYCDVSGLCRAGLRCSVMCCDSAVVSARGARVKATAEEGP